MDFHSPYQQSMGDVVFWTWMDEGGPSAPDEPIYRSVAQGLQSHTLTENGNHYGGLPGFNTLPKEQNWVYANTQICALLMEITQDNYWTGAMVDTIAARVGRGNFYLMDRALVGPGVCGAVTDAASGAPLQGEIRIQELSEPGIGPYLADPETGRYWRFLNGGTCTLTVHVKDHEDQTRTISIGSGWDVEDFALVPVQSAVSGPQPSGGPGQAALVAENPLRAGGIIRLRAAPGEKVSCELFDLRGSRVRCLFSGTSPVSERSLVFDGLDGSGKPLLPGVYLSRTEVDGKVSAGKIAYVR
jgi:hypothetical protein